MSSLTGGGSSDRPRWASNGPEGDWMAKKPWILGAIGALVLVGLSVGPAGAQQATPPDATPTPAAAAAPKAEAPPVCGDCHEDQVKAFAANPHARMPEKWRPTAGSPNSLCESCHGDGTKHIEGSGDK